MSIIDDMVHRTHSSALTTIETLYHTADCCRLAILDRIPGDFVECGVYQGAHPAVMAAVIMARSWDTHWRQTWLFDSFQGIPESGEHDDWPGLGADTVLDRPKLGRLASTNIAVCSEAEVRQNMRSWGVHEHLLRWRPGWFEETMQVEPLPEQIAVLRLDGDLYSATKCCLEALYPRLSKGGHIIVDDFALRGCNRACVEYFGFEPHLVFPTFQVVDPEQGCAAWIKP